jgi:hypothetical protein
MPAFGDILLASLSSSPFASLRMLWIEGTSRNRSRLHSLVSTRLHLFALPVNIFKRRVGSSPPADASVRNVEHPPTQCSDSRTSARLAPLFGAVVSASTTRTMTELGCEQRRFGLRGFFRCAAATQPYNQTIVASPPMQSTTNSEENFAPLLIFQERGFS